MISLLPSVMAYVLQIDADGYVGSENYVQKPDKVMTQKQEGFRKPYGLSCGKEYKMGRLFRPYIVIIALLGICSCSLDLSEVLDDLDDTDEPPVSDSDSDGDGDSDGDDQGNGLTGVYFNDMSLSNEVLERIDPSINFDWGEGAPASQMEPHTFSVRWTGSVKPRFSETYTYTTASDDGVRLWIDNELIISNWTDHSLEEDSGTITLEAGELYNIKLEYFDNTVDAVIKLYWSSPGQSRQIVPSSRLFTDYDAPPVDPPTTDEVVDATTMNEKIMAGYQGWFNADGDGAGYGWRHWSRGNPDPDSISFDIWAVFCR